MFKNMIMLVVLLLSSQLCTAETEIDFSQTQCFGVSDNTIQINNIIVTSTIENPLDLEFTYYIHH
jgi:hypothetical protein